MEININTEQIDVRCGDFIVNNDGEVRQLVYACKCFFFIDPNIGYQVGNYEYNREDAVNTYKRDYGILKVIKSANIKLEEIENE